MYLAALGLGLGLGLEQGLGLGLEEVFVLGLGLGMHCNHACIWRHFCGTWLATPLPVQYTGGGICYC